MIEAQPRQFGAVNWLGAWTLYVKEVRRFLKVPLQTIVAPVIAAVLFLAVFALAFGDRVSAVQGVTYLDYIVPGLIMMAVIQNAFANTSSSIIISKIDVKSAYRRGTVSGDLAARRITIVCGFALLIRCLPFGGSHCPNLWCVASETITDLGNDLLSCPDWDESAIFHLMCRS